MTPWRRVCRRSSGQWTFPARCNCRASLAGFKLFHLLLEFAYFPLQLRPAVEYGLGFEPLAVFHGRIAGVQRGGRNVVGDPAFRSDDRAVTDGEVAGGAPLAGKDRSLTELGGAGK